MTPRPTVLKPVVPLRALDTYQIPALVENAAALVKLGYGAVGFYYFTTSKFKERMTVADAKSLCKAGLRLFAVWENGSPTTESYFTAAQGMIDGAAALAQAKLLKQPIGTMIFFAVDYDAAESHLEAIENYFAEVDAQMFPSYRVGVYGSGSTCLFLTLWGEVQAGWLAQSTGWSGYERYIPHAAIVQGKSAVALGMDVDSDTVISPGNVTWVI